MTQTIYKYPLQIMDEQKIVMPVDAELLTVQMQGSQPCLWAVVDPTKSLESRKILIRGTGHDCPGVGRYISTFQMQGGALVFHAFEA